MDNERLFKRVRFTIYLCYICTLLFICFIAVLTRKDNAANTLYLSARMDNVIHQCLGNVNTDLLNQK